VTAYYNEIDPFAVDWLKNLIRQGNIPHGDVDDRSIEDVCADDLHDYDQHHFFAGIGGLAYACRLAGWPDDRPIVTGGFPCQDISPAGAGRGLSGAKSGLWFPLFECIRVLRPDAVLLENSSALVRRGLDTVVGNMASIRYSAEWDCLSAGEIGAPHERERIYIFSYPDLFYGQAGLGVFPLRQKTVSAASDRLRNTLWLASSRPAVGVADGVPVHLVRRAATEGFGNAVVPEAPAEVLRAVLNAEAGIDAGRDDGMSLQAMLE
jgi:site-specific DNA-cytosine methylase